MGIAEASIANEQLEQHRSGRPRTTSKEQNRHGQPAARTGSSKLTTEQAADNEARFGHRYIHIASGATKAVTLPDGTITAMSRRMRRKAQRYDAKHGA